MKILFVYDIPEIRMGLRGFLEKAGHEVLTARNNEEAIKVLRSRETDVLISQDVESVINAPGFCPGIRTVLLVDVKARKKYPSVADLVLVDTIEPENLLWAINDL